MVNQGLFMDNLKYKVKEFWEKISCGEIYAKGVSDKEKYKTQAIERYNLEPYLFDFAKFDQGENKIVLEIGVGMGADHIEWAKSSPKLLVGSDLTERAANHTKKRLSLYGFESNIQIGDAEKLHYKSNSFDLVYSWGVLHHSPDTSKTINEVLRVLKPNGTAKIMLYNKYSIVGFILWIRYALLKGTPFLNLSYIYATYLESPGTKAFTIDQTKSMFSGFSKVSTHIQISLGDLLLGSVGQKHKGILLDLAKIVWPRYLIKKLFKNYGLFLLIEAVK